MERWEKGLVPYSEFRRHRFRAEPGAAATVCFNLLPEIVPNIEVEATNHPLAINQINGFNRNLDWDLVHHYMFRAEKCNSA